MKKLMLTAAMTALCAGVLAGSVDTYPYGICAHVTRSERDPHNLHGTLISMELAGMKYVRSDFDAWRVRKGDGTYDFSNYDALLDELDKAGVTLLPIIYGVENPPKDMAKHAEYIKQIIRHFGKRFPVVEIWNEANLNGFLKGCDPIVYAETLKASYAAVKSVDPSIRVAYTGTAGVPLDWIRKTFQAGATNCFDIMCIHPYTHPAQPEGGLDRNTEKLKKLMTEFGVADRPIWFTEIGWPTHTLSIPQPHIMLAGLKTARPEQKSWKVVMADSSTVEPVPSMVDLAKSLEDLLPPGSTVKACSQPETIRLLRNGGVDAVVYPFDESFPADTVGAVNDFIRDGGVFVDFGGLPCYFGRRDGANVEGSQHGASIGRFPFGYNAWWLNKNTPERTQTFATERGLAAGVKQEPTGFKSERFLSPDRIGKDSEWIPLLAGKAKDGSELVSAVTIRYHGERKGAAVLCSLWGSSGTNNEENQARFTARSLAIGFAEGVEAFFTYNLRAGEVDPFYSEHHFGLMHADFTPKPAFSAYAAFTRERPAGSVQKTAAWHNDKRSFFFPQWKRPDGKFAGMVWKLGVVEKMRLRFTGSEPLFHDMYGRKIAVRKLSNDEWEVKVGESPVYFIGAELVNP